MINQNCSLICRDLYSYDIVSAFPTIMGQINYDFKNIDLDNKIERNIFIGREQKDNEILSSYLNQSVESLLSFYLKDNNIQENEIITSQKDGFILTKKLSNNDQFIEIKLREYIDFLILSIDRKKFLYCSNGKIIVKGVSYFYDKLSTIYQQFSNLNFYNKKNLFLQLETIKNSIMNSDDKNFFLIPKSKKSFIVSTFRGDLEVTDSNLISLTSIDKRKYFDHYFKPFFQSIFLACY